SVVEIKALSKKILKKQKNIGETTILKKVITNIVEAHSQLNYGYDSHQINPEKLDQALSLINCVAIYGFVELVDMLGLKISIHVKEVERE
ncbi:MAG: hypothetical protein ACKPEZ_19340, partial [Planktothrix sp.]